MAFSETAYYKEKFSALSLSGETVSSLRFEACTFSECRLVDCKFEKCVFIDCKFEGCTLSAVNPEKSRFLQPGYFHCKVMGFDWAKAAKLQEISFTDCHLDYSNFSSLQFPKVRMIKCSAKEARFVETDMTDGVFTGTDFQGSTIFKSNFTRADFRQATNYNIDVRNNVIKNARFSLPEALSLLYGLEIVIE
jgi:fluoroquinolone resistance protein